MRQISSIGLSYSIFRLHYYESKNKQNGVTLVCEEFKYEIAHPYAFILICNGLCTSKVWIGWNLIRFSERGIVKHRVYSCKFLKRLKETEINLITL